MNLINDNNCGWINNLNKRLNIKNLNKNKFYDLSLMGVGTNILGYSNKAVDERDRKSTSLNSSH